MEKQKLEQDIKDSYNQTYNLILGYYKEFGNYPNFRGKVYPNSPDPVLNTFFDTESL